MPYSCRNLKDHYAAVGGETFSMLVIGKKSSTD